MLHIGIIILKVLATFVSALAIDDVGKGYWDRSSWIVFFVIVAAIWA